MCVSEQPLDVGSDWNVCVHTSIVELAKVYIIIYPLGGWA